MKIALLKKFFRLACRLMKFNDCKNFLSISPPNDDKYFILAQKFALQAKKKNIMRMVDETNKDHYESFLKQNTIISEEAEEKVEDDKSEEIIDDKLYDSKTIKEKISSNLLKFDTNKDLYEISKFRKLFSKNDSNKQSLNERRQSKFLSVNEIPKVHVSDQLINDYKVDLLNETVKRNKTNQEDFEKIEYNNSKEKSNKVFDSENLKNIHESDKTTVKNDANVNESKLDSKLETVRLLQEASNNLLGSKNSSYYGINLKNKDKKTNNSDEESSINTKIKNQEKIDNKSIEMMQLKENLEENKLKSISNHNNTFKSNNSSEDLNRSKNNKQENYSDNVIIIDEKSFINKNKTHDQIKTIPEVKDSFKSSFVVEKNKSSNNNLNEIDIIGENNVGLKKIRSKIKSEEEIKEREKTNFLYDDNLSINVQMILIENLKSGEYVYYCLNILNSIPDNNLNTDLSE